MNQNDLSDFEVYKMCSETQVNIILLQPAFELQKNWRQRTFLLVHKV